MVKELFPRLYSYYLWLILINLSLVYYISTIQQLVDSTLGYQQQSVEVFFFLFPMFSTYLGEIFDIYYIKMVFHQILLIISDQVLYINIKRKRILF